MAEIVHGLAATLAPATGIDPGSLRLRISQALAVWATERSPASFAKTVYEFERFIDHWSADARPTQDSLCADDIAATVISLRRIGTPDGSLLAYLTAIATLLDRLGFMSSELRAGLLQLRRNHTPRTTRKRWHANVPTLHAEVARLVRGADAMLPRDVRNMVMVLILFEGMAQFSEIVGSIRRAKTTSGLLVSDVRFEAAGTSVVSLVAPHADASRRSVRLSSDATAWLKHWMTLRGDEPGSLLSYGKANPRGPQLTSRCDSMPLWQGREQFRQLAFRHGTSGFGLSAESLRLGRAVGLLDAGWNVSRIAMAGGWTSAAALVRLMDAGLSVLPQGRRRREPGKLWWPLPVPEEGSAQEPYQLDLRLVDGA
jgi:integrase